MESKRYLGPSEKLSITYAKIEKQVANLRLVMLKSILGDKKEDKIDTSIKYVTTKLEELAGEEKNILEKALLQCESS